MSVLDKGLVNNDTKGAQRQNERPTPNDHPSPRRSVCRSCGRRHLFFFSPRGTGGFLVHSGLGMRSFWLILTWLIPASVWGRKGGDHTGREGCAKETGVELGLAAAADDDVGYGDGNDGGREVRGGLITHSFAAPAALPAGGVQLWRPGGFPGQSAGHEPMAWGGNMRYMTMASRTAAKRGLRYCHYSTVYCIGWVFFWEGILWWRFCGFCLLDGWVDGWDRHEYRRRM